MSNIWTQDQKLAIDFEGGNILVNAAAGSGKTAVLVERVIRKITDGGSADRLLIVTFTIKAAREMRERISLAINKSLAKNPNNMHLNRQAVLIQRAKICTIDSFYSGLVKSNFNVLGVAPNFKIIDEVEYALLKREVLTNLFEERYDASQRNSDFIKLSDNFSTDKSDSGLFDVVLDMNRRLESVPFTEKRIAEMSGLYDPKNNHGFLNSVFGKSAGADILENIKYQINRYNNFLIELSELPELYDSINGLLHDDLSKAENAAIKLSENDWDGFVKAVSVFSFDAMRPPRRFTEDPLKLKAAEIRDGLKSCIKGLKSNFAVSEEENNKDLIKSYTIVKALCALISDFDKALTAEKEKIGAYCFADISKMALSLCVDENSNPTLIAKELSEEYDEIMIDEYQDTNEIQDLIFTAISDNSKKLFLVGDVKQSIYGFRNACPDIFIDRKEKSSLINEGKFPLLINLSKNFRSRIEVIDFVNLIFSRLMCKSLGGVSYDDSEKLFVGAEYPDGNNNFTEIEIIDLGEENAEENEEEDLISIEKEAIFTAQKIKQMLDSGFTVNDKATGGKRPVKAKDFAVLLRSMKDKGEIFRKALEDAGVGAFCEEGISYFEAYEVITVLSVLRTIDNPFNDIPLISAMRSPAFFFSSDELAEIRLYDREAPFYSAVKLAAESGNEKAIFFIKKINYYKELSRQLPVYRLLSFIYTDTGIFSVFGGMDNGEMRQNNLNQLVRHAKNYEDSGAKGVYGFVSFIDKIIEDKDGNISGAKPAPSSDSVFISTIHKSKGLEYPICILANTAKRFNRDDTKSNMLFHKDYGFGFMLSDVSGGFRYTTLQRETIKNVILNESIAEEIRVLYVAMTRAREKLIIIGCVKNLEGTLEKAAESSDNLSTQSIKNGANCFDWILSCIIGCESAKPLQSKIKKLSVLSEDKTDFKVGVKFYNNIAINKISASKKEKADTKKSLAFIKERLDFKYENSELSKQPVKLSVTELKGRKTDIIDAKELFVTNTFAVPDFEGSEKLTANEAGTAVHRVMQYLTLKEYSSLNELKEEIGRMTVNNILSEREAKAINIKAVFTFVNSKLYKKMLKSKEVIREYRFTVPVPLSKIEETIKSDETVLVQGVIDCFFEWDDGYVIIDYKTDKTYGTDYKAELLKKYRVQLEFYKYAVELLFSKRVNETVIYSYSANDIIEC